MAMNVISLRKLLIVHRNHFVETNAKTMISANFSFIHHASSEALIFKHFANCLSTHIARFSTTICFVEDCSRNISANVLSKYLQCDRQDCKF